MLIWHNMILIFADIEVSKLRPGVNRPQSWIDEHPAFMKMQEKLIRSFKKDGVRYPLCAINDRDDGTYIVSVGNKRLAALQGMGANYAPCLIANEEDQKNIPKGKLIESENELLKYFGGKVKRLVLDYRMFQVVPYDDDDWDQDKVFG